jgi:hypothetical protein
MGASADPNANNPFNKFAGPAGWLIAIITGVGFIGMLYSGASHGEGGHGDAHGAAPAADHGADHADKTEAAH